MGSLLEDIEEWYKEESYPPDGVDLSADTEQIAWKVIDDSPRWGNVIQAVYKRGDELVAVEDIEPATEMQDWGDYGEPTIYTCQPETVIMVEYVEVVG